MHLYHIIDFDIYEFLAGSITSFCAINRNDNDDCYLRMLKQIFYISQFITFITQLTNPTESKHFEHSISNSVSWSTIIFVDTSAYFSYTEYSLLYNELRLCSQLKTSGCRHEIFVQKDLMNWKHPLI